MEHSHFYLATIETVDADKTQMPCDTKGAGTKDVIFNLDTVLEAEFIPMKAAKWYV